MKIAHPNENSCKIKKKFTSLLTLQYKKQILLKHVIMSCVCGGGSVSCIDVFFSLLARTPNKNIYLNMNLMVYIKMRKCFIMAFSSHIST